MIRILLEIFKRYSATQKKIITLVLAGVLVAALGMKFIVFSDLNEIRQTKLAIQAELIRKNSLLRGVPAQAQIEAQKAGLSKSKQPDWMTDAVRQAAEQSGLVLISVSPRNPVKKEFFEEFSLLVEAQGGYHQTGKFVAYLENHTPSIIIKHLRLERNSSKDSDRRLKVVCHLTAYYEILAGVT